LCIRAKLRGSPKALITKLFRETLKVASLMPEGIVISLEMIGIYYKNKKQKIFFLEMGDRGSKSLCNFNNNSVKEQRVDGSSIYKLTTKIVRCTLIAGKSGSKVNYLSKF
jgi:hypothetical protein